MKIYINIFIYFETPNNILSKNHYTQNINYIPNLYKIFYKLLRNFEILIFTKNINKNNYINKFIIYLQL